eukprot:1161471-Pelagomonas_calceolata.AAC.6
MKRSGSSKQHQFKSSCMIKLRTGETLDEHSQLPQIRRKRCCNGTTHAPGYRRRRCDDCFHLLASSAKHHLGAAELRIRMNLHSIRRSGCEQEECSIF